jgi:hypothetical protein
MRKTRLYRLTQENVQQMLADYLSDHDDSLDAFAIESVKTQYESTVLTITVEVRDDD